MEKLIAELYRVSPAVVERAKAMMTGAPVSSVAKP
jgi:hypothetical protein